MRSAPSSTSRNLFNQTGSQLEQVLPSRVPAVHLMNLMSTEATGAVRSEMLATRAYCGLGRCASATMLLVVAETQTSASDAGSVC